MSRLYSKNPIEIDLMACSSAGDVLSSYVAEVSETAWSNWSIEDKFTFKLVFIAICHNINWNYLQNTLAEKFIEDPFRLSTNFLEKVNATTFKKWLSNYDKPDRIRAKERAALIRDIGFVLNNKFSGKAFNIYLRSDGTLYGSRGLHSLLNEFKAYSSDPLRKKANVLIHDLMRENIVSFPDIDLIEPAVEYHIMRLYERTGRVYSRKEELRAALTEGEPLTPWFIKVVRQKVAEALSYTAGVAKKTVPDVNYIEWQIARIICKANIPNCIAEKDSSNELPEDIRRIFRGSCPYIKFCYAFAHPEDLELREPIPRKNKSHY